MSSSEWDRYINFVFDKFGFLKSEGPYAFTIGKEKLTLRPGQSFGLTISGFVELWSQAKDYRVINYEGCSVGYWKTGRRKNAEKLTDRELIGLLESLEKIESSGHPVLDGWLMNEIVAVKDELNRRVAKGVFAPRGGIGFDHAKNARTYIHLAVEMGNPAPTLADLAKASGISKSSWDRMKKDLAFLTVLLDTAKKRQGSQKFTRTQERKEFMTKLLLSIADLITVATSKKSRTTHEGGARSLTGDYGLEDGDEESYQW